MDLDHGDLVRARDCEAPAFNVNRNSGEFLSPADAAHLFPAGKIVPAHHDVPVFERHQLGVLIEADGVALADRIMVPGGSLRTTDRT
jgi:hypothetical protein